MGRNHTRPEHKPSRGRRDTWTLFLKSIYFLFARCHHGQLSDPYFSKRRLGRGGHGLKRGVWHIVFNLFPSYGVWKAWGVSAGMVEAILVREQSCVSPLRRLSPPPSYSSPHTGNVLHRNHEESWKTCFILLSLFLWRCFSFPLFVWCVLFVSRLWLGKREQGGKKHVEVVQIYVTFLNSFEMAWISQLDGKTRPGNK